MRKWTIGLVGLFIGCWAGCSRENPSAPVSGSVLFKGKPLTSGRVIFLHPEGPSAFGDIEPDGSYQLMAPVGDNRVAVECLEDPEQPSPQPNLYVKPKALAQSLIPERYSNHMTSGLTCTVQAGENRADFELKE